MDEWSPVIAGSELGEHPFEPITVESRRRAAELGDDLPVEWRHRDERYSEKLATPDTSVADLIGDVDPMRVAEGRRLGDPETIHFGLIPRSHRGIVAINELPDLAERIQVAMLNVMEERDIQIRGYVLRLPLDVLVVASANPEDYTNRGRIITPLKDRFGAEIRTHYPHELADEVAVIRQEAGLVATVPDALLEVVARFTRSLRSSPAVDQRSGVSARFAIAGPRPWPRRRCIGPPSSARTRPSPASSTSRPRSTCCGARSSSSRARRDASARCSPTSCARPPPRPAAPPRRRRPRPARRGDRGRRPRDDGRAGRRPRAPRGLPVLGESTSTRRSATVGATTVGERASAVELALEGLYLARRIAKDSVDGETVYG